MKKKLQFFLVLFLTYSFICCPVLGGLSYADEVPDEGSRPVKAFLQQTMNTIKSTTDFIFANLPEWIESYTFPASVEDVKNNLEKRKGIRNDILDKLGYPFIRSPK